MFKGKLLRSMIALCITISGCQVAQHKDQAYYLELQPTEFNNIHSWHHNDFTTSLAAFQKSCTQVSHSKKATVLSQHPFFGRVDDWEDVCQKAQYQSPQEARAFFEAEFKPVKVSNKTNGMFTGYYIPELRGSFTRTERYRYPLYALPDERDLPERADIVIGALNGFAEPILWVDSEIDSFFLHIQGSGNVVLPDNKVIHVSYAGHNGHKYYAIGRYLMETQEIPKSKMSAEAIKTWLRDHPDRAQYVMNMNPSYVFFKIASDNQLAKGAANVPLTPEYSLAVDDRYYPYGVPIWVETGVNVPSQYSPRTSKMAFERLMVAQDTGGAIEGPVRGDIFFGYGKNAEIMASAQKEVGNKYLLLPRSAVTRAI